VCLGLSLLLLKFEGTRTPHFPFSSIFSYVTSMSLEYFTALYRKWIQFGEKVIEYKMRVLIFTATFVWNFSLQKGQGEIIS